MAQELEGSGLHIFLCPKQLSSTCHVSFFAAPDTVHKHKFSLTHLIYLTYLSDSLTNTHKIFGTRSTFCHVPRQSGGSTQIPSLTELQVRPWTWCLNAALTIIGILKGTVINQMRGRVSHDSPYWTKHFQVGFHGPGSD